MLGSRVISLTSSDSGAADRANLGVYVWIDALHRSFFWTNARETQTAACCFDFPTVFNVVIFNPSGEGMPRLLRFPVALTESGT